MKEAFKRYLYNILGCFIMLLDIASIIIFCLEYLGVNYFIHSSSIYYISNHMLYSSYGFIIFTK